MPSPTSQQSPSTPYFPDEISKHSSADDLWIIIDGDVYDVSNFMNEHPGGPKILLTVAGKDATKKFRKYHRDAILNRYKERLRVGSVVDEGKKSRFSLKAMLKK